MAKISQKKFQGPIFRHIDKCLKNRWISSMIWTNFLLMLYLGHSLKSTLEIIQWNSMKMMWGICLMKTESPLLQSVLIEMGKKCKYVMLFIIFFIISYTSLNIYSFNAEFCTLKYTFYHEIFRDTLEYHAYKKDTTGCSNSICPKTNTY